MELGGGKSEVGREMGGGGRKLTFGTIRHTKHPGQCKRE